MLTTHDDVPHPVPPTAYLRYKENWFWIFVDVRNQIFGMAHFNYEPGFGRARVSCNLLVRGELHQYGNEIPFPENFAYSKEIGDDKLKVRFVEAHTEFGFSLANDALNFQVTLRKHAPTFDYEAYTAANPEKPTVKEAATLGTNTCFHHQQQALTMKGTLEMKTGKLKGEKFNIDAMAYRDHSRAIRCDNMTLKHTWSFLYFPKRVLGVMGVYSVLRPSIAANEGYVYDGSGMRSLKDIEITTEGKSDEFLPATVKFKMNDIEGNNFTIVADIENRFGNVPLAVEKPGGGLPAYRIHENFVPLKLEETGEEGYALVEIGDNPSYTGSGRA
ncbi:MAG TPA: hypothetical protein VJS42_14400 [Steroidobacteraceae bacterium]|nr:hypothetical protein [Steroidobacteraceae bacterium]